MRRRVMQVVPAALAGVLLLGFSLEAAAQPCLVFVHGRQGDTATFNDWNAARDYWRENEVGNTPRDFIAAATKGFQAPYYVVGYNGTRPYWDAEAAGHVAGEIANAAAGGADGGGNTCAGASSLWVIAHSMGNNVMDFVLGNANSSDPNFNFNGPYDAVADGISLVISVGGSHRGSEGADAVCGEAGFLCNAIAFFIDSCDDSAFWLRSDDSVQVRRFSTSPARNVFLTGGFEAIVGASACLSGEDDGVVQHASQYACGGSATTGFNNSNVCGNDFKQESSGFFNIDSGHENHDDERNDGDRDDRVAIPDGLWTCGGSPCSPGTTVTTSLSAAQLVGLLF